MKFLVNVKDLIFKELVESMSTDSIVVWILGGVSMYLLPEDL